jgi:hypothetical protein
MKNQKADCSPKVIAGCARLQARRSPGQTFTTSEIAAECGVDDQSIAYTERMALRKFSRELLRHAGLIEEIFPAYTPQRLARGLALLAGSRGSPARRISA